MRILLFVVLASISTGQAQNTQQPRLIGGRCEGCEAIFEFGDRTLSPVDTLPDFAHTDPKIRISGTIYEADGSTPAAGVILYVYHTDRTGVYATKGNESGWARRHGYIRGWMKTGNDGRYTFYTFRPASYPNSTAPQHIHPTLLEPDGRYYWVSEYLFDDDPNLTALERDQDDARGSGGVIVLRKEGSLFVGERDFVLGKNVPGYNEKTR